MLHLSTVIHDIGTYRLMTQKVLLQGEACSIQDSRVSYLFTSCSPLAKFVVANYRNVGQFLTCFYILTPVVSDKVLFTEVQTEVLPSPKQKERLLSVQLGAPNARSNDSVEMFWREVVYHRHSFVIKFGCHIKTY